MTKTLDPENTSESTFTSKQGTKLHFSFEDSTGQGFIKESSSKEARSIKDVGENVEKLMAKLYKKDSPVPAKAFDAYDKVVSEQGMGAGDHWMRQFESQLIEQEELGLQRTNIFSNDVLARATKGKAPLKTLESVENPVNNYDFRKSLRDKDAPDIIKNRQITPELLIEIEAAKLDVASDMMGNDNRINILLTGATLTPDQISPTRKLSNTNENRGLLVGMAMATAAGAKKGIEWAYKQKDAKDVGEGMFGRVQDGINVHILSEPAMHKDLSNPFFEMDKTLDRKGKDFEQTELGKFSKAEDEAHAAARKKLNEELAKKNEEFYAKLDNVAEMQYDNRFGRLIRLLLIANPFFGGIFAGCTLLGPIMSVLDGTRSFNELVGLPLEIPKFLFKEGISPALGEVLEAIPNLLNELGADIDSSAVSSNSINEGVATSFNKVGDFPPFKFVGSILDLPNQLIGTATDIAHPILSALPIEGEMSQLLIAGAALIWEADKTAKINDAKSRIERGEQGGVDSKGKKIRSIKEEFADIFENFHKDTLERRMKKVGEFAKKQAVTDVKEEEKDHVSSGLKGKIPEVLDRLDDEDRKNLIKLFEEKGGEGSKIENLGEFLAKNINNTDVRKFMLTALAVAEENKINDLKTALKSTAEFDAYLANKSTKAQSIEDIFVKDFYKLKPDASDEMLKTARNEKIGLQEVAIRREFDPFIHNYTLKTKEKVADAVFDDLTVKKGSPTQDSISGVDNQISAQVGLQQGTQRPVGESATVGVTQGTQRPSKEESESTTVGVSQGTARPAKEGESATAGIQQNTSRPSNLAEKLARAGVNLADFEGLVGNRGNGVEASKPPTSQGQDGGSRNGGNSR